MKLLLLCLVACVAYVDCRGGGRGGGRGSRRSGGNKGSFGWGKSSWSHTYPASSGYSGHGSGGTHGYPPSNGLSGLGNQRGLRYGQRYGSYRYVPRVPSVPSYYIVPQYMYIKQYKSSNSRFNNLLIGLTMYNMGRSHVYHNHYYQDSYYRRSSSTSSSFPASPDQTTKTKDEATCVLRITEDEREQVLKIPCAIVTTFTDCLGDQTSTVYNVDIDKSTGLESTMNDSDVDRSKTVEKDSLENQMISKLTTQSIDPLLVTGPPLKMINMKCTIEIRTLEKVISNDVECKTLLLYAKIPVPEKKDALIMPPRWELKEMLEHPPWWLSLFLAV